MNRLLAILVFTMHGIGCSTGTEDNHVDAGTDSHVESDSRPDSYVEPDSQPDSQADSQGPDHNADCSTPIHVVFDLGCDPEEKCSFVSPEGLTYSIACLPRDEDAELSAGAPCSVVADGEHGLRDHCPPGYMCEQYDPLRGPRCIRLCHALEVTMPQIGVSTCGQAYPDGSDGYEDAVCLYDLTRLSQFVFGCLPVDSCDLLCQDCPQGPVPVGCVGTSTFERAVTFCEPFARIFEGVGRTGDFCEIWADCLPGYHCYDDGSGLLWNGQCRKYCSLSGQSPCSGSSCDPGDGTCQIPLYAGLPYGPLVFGQAQDTGLCLEPEGTP